MYLTEAYLQDAFGAAQVAALCPTPGSLTTTIELAEAEVESALFAAGYSAAVPSTVYTAIDDVPKTIKLAAYGAWLVHAHGRNSIEVPTAYAAFVAKFTALQNGTLEIPNVAKTTARAVGGIIRTEADPSIDGARPAIFARDEMEGY